MTISEKGTLVDRRAFLAGVAGSLVAAALPATAAQAAPTEVAPMNPYPSTWPDLKPYGRADTRLDLWPRNDNSFILPLEVLPRDKAGRHVWMRDTYVNCFDVDGRPMYVATGTSRVPVFTRPPPGTTASSCGCPGPCMGRGGWSTRPASDAAPRGGRCGRPGSSERTGPDARSSLPGRSTGTTTSSASAARCGPRRRTTFAARGTSSRAWVTTPGRSVRSCS